MLQTLNSCSLLQEVLGSRGIVERFLQRVAEDELWLVLRGLQRGLDPRWAEKQRQWNRPEIAALMERTRHVWQKPEVDGAAELPNLLSKEWAEQQRQWNKKKQKKERNSKETDDLLFRHCQRQTV